MSAIVYNGVTLPYPEIIQFQQVALGDTVSQTDWYVTKFDVNVVCHINFNYLNLLYPGLVVGGQPVTTNPADIMRVIKPKLMARRKSFSMKFAGVELIPQGQTGVTGTVDAQNGPVPQSCTHVEVTNSMFIIQWHVIAHYWENNSVNPNGSPIVTNLPGNVTLFNRWSESININNLDFSTKIREGKFVIRSDNSQGKIADQVRTQLASVSVPSGFLRKSANYTVSPDGLGISYRIEDEETFRKPPKPSWEADGAYWEDVTNHGALRYANIQLTLKGSKSENQTSLINTALKVAAKRLLIRESELNDLNWGGNNLPVGFRVLESASLRHSLYSNEVSLEMRAMYSADQPGINGVGAFYNMSGVTPGSDETYTPPYNLRGTGGILLQAAAYYDPSLRNRLGTQIQKTTDTLKVAVGDSIEIGPGIQVGKAGISPEV